MQKYFYVITFQYLGYRYHGWSKQPNVKTVHKMIDRTINFVLGEQPFKTLGSSRTDAMVSANMSAFELFTSSPIVPTVFFEELNKNLPMDIRALGIKEVDDRFNIIKSAKTKQYIYLFSFGQKAHPFCASLLTCFPFNLDIELMKIGASCFEGNHNFKMYCKRTATKTDFIRSVSSCSIDENNFIQASFFPEKTYCLKVEGKGFMRNQIRLMMGQLLCLGKGEITLDELKDTLLNPQNEQVRFLAPASGLILNKLSFKDTDEEN